jgi:hypothetical protein
MLQTRTGWPLLGLLAVLACSACAGSPQVANSPLLVAGCHLGGIDSSGNRCTAFNQPVGANSRVPFDGINSR